MTFPLLVGPGRTARKSPPSPALAGAAARPLTLTPGAARSTKIRTRRATRRDDRLMWRERTAQPERNLRRNAAGDSISHPQPSGVPSGRQRRPSATARPPVSHAEIAPQLAVFDERGSGRCSPRLVFPEVPVGGGVD